MRGLCRLLMTQLGLCKVALAQLGLVHGAVACRVVMQPASCAVFFIISPLLLLLPTSRGCCASTLV